MPIATTTGTERTFQKEAVRMSVLEATMNASATAAAGAATLNQGFGQITTETITTAAAATYSLTITNSVVTATDIAFASVQNGTNTINGAVVTRVTPGAGTLAIVVQNAGVSALSGNLKINFLVVKKGGAIL